MSEALDRWMDEKSVSEKIEEELEKLRRKAKRPVKYTEEQRGALLDAFRRIFSERKGKPPSPEIEKKAVQRIMEMGQFGFSIERAYKEIEKFAREQAAIRTPEEAEQVAEKIRNLFISQYRSLLHEDPPPDLSQSIYETAKDMSLEGRPYSEIVEWMERIVRERARAQRATRARGALPRYIERLEQLAYGGMSEEFERFERFEHSRILGDIISYLRSAIKDPTVKNRAQRMAREWVYMGWRVKDFRRYEDWEHLIFFPAVLDYLHKLLEQAPSRALVEEFEASRLKETLERMKIKHVIAGSLKEKLEKMKIKHVRVVGFDELEEWEHKKFLPEVLRFILKSMEYVDKELADIWRPRIEADIERLERYEH